MPTVSVIVPTKNEQHNIARLLATVPPEIEVVVCDASEDSTRQVIEKVRPHNTLIIDAPGTIAEARQRGALVSGGDILVFTDADVEFDGTYFQRLVERTDWDARCGAKLSRGPFAADYEWMVRAQLVAYHWLGVAAASGSNMAMTRSAFFAIGGFRAKLACNEDTELFLRAGRQGLVVQFDERLVVWAGDHRRLRRGRIRKALHSLVRNSLLYFTCGLPRLPHLLEHDWGYWRTS